MFLNIAKPVKPNIGALKGKWGQDIINIIINTKPSDLTILNAKADKAKEILLAEGK